MARSQVEIVGKSLNKIKDRIKEELSSLDIDYTGQLSDSLKVNNTAFGATLTAEDYLPTAFQGGGRGAGGRPFIDPDWVRAKIPQPRDFTTGRFMSAKSLAILISMKIGREGTNRFIKSGVGSLGIEINTIIEEEKPNLLKKLNISFAKEFTTVILSISKN